MNKKTNDDDRNSNNMLNPIFNNISDSEKLSYYVNSYVISDHIPIDIQIMYHTPGLIHAVQKDGSDWIDLRAAEDVTMTAGEFRLISLGISVKLPPGYEIVIVPRSSTFKNFKIIQPNSPGIIDNSYCGDLDIIKYPAYAMEDTQIFKNDRICQFRVQQNQPKINFIEVDHLGVESRGGFGSTGVK